MPHYYQQCRRSVEVRWWGVHPMCVNAGKVHCYTHSLSLTIFLNTHDIHKITNCNLQIIGISLRCGLVVRIPGFHPGGPGSIPGTGTLF